MRLPLTRLGVRGKLHALNALVVVAFLLAALVAGRVVDEVRIGGAHYAQIRSREAATRDVAVLQAGLAETMTSLVSIAAEPDAQKRATGLRMLQQRTALIDERFTVVVGNTHDDAVRVALDDARTTWLQFSEAIDQEIGATLQAGRTAEAMALVQGVQRRRYERFAEQLTAVMDGLQARIHEFEAEVGKTVRASLVAALAAAGALLAALVAVAALIARSIVRPIAALESAATRVAKGDLREKVAVQGTDEIAALATSFQAMSEGLRGMAVDLQQGADAVQAEATQILGAATRQAAMASQQTTAIHETSTTVAEIAQTSRQATKHADQVIEIALRSEDVSREGQRVLDEAKAGIEGVAEQVKAIAATAAKLSERTVAIGDIIATVKDIAEQSNVLALNAAIEASKAGEQGRGFAVVAAEMRNLAEQSKRAAGQVRAILGEIHGGAHEVAGATAEGAARAAMAIRLAQTADEVIVGLAGIIRESSLAARQIANNTRQQTVGVDQIVAAITELSSAMQQTMEGTQSIEATTAGLTTIAERLSGMLRRYQV